MITTCRTGVMLYKGGREGERERGREGGREGGDGAMKLLEE